MDPGAVLDVYEPDSGTPSTSQAEGSSTTTAQPTLTEEVAQLTGQLGRFWGGFRKQSINAFESARKLDLASVATKAQSDLASAASKAQSDLASAATRAQLELRNLQGDLQEAMSSQSSQSSAPAESTETAASTSTATLVTEKGSVDDSGAPSTPPLSSDTSSITGPEEPTTPKQGPISPIANLPSFLSKLQSSLPPNLVSSVQANLQEQMRNAPDLTQLRSTLAAEVKRVQDVTRAQAGEYAAVGEGLFREAVQGAEEFFRDAVRVVPPEGAAGAPRGDEGVFLAGTDVWMMDVGGPVDADEGQPGDVKGKGKEVDAREAVATRAQALLRKLRSDPEVLRPDPAEDPTMKEIYAAWVAKEVTSHEDGIRSPYWTERIVEELESVDGDALDTTMETLTPAVMKKAEFWTRYFFRVHQVQQDEERRRALLQGSMEKEEDFSWEDEDEDQTTTTTSAPRQPSSAAPKPTATPGPTTAPVSTATSVPAVAPASQPEAQEVPPSIASSTQDLATAAVISPRHSSEGSYDVVSSNVSTSGDAEKDRKAVAEEEDEEEEEEEDEDEEDSDWE